ncbi:MAG: hypothetical protein OHK0039_07790 [Bacteroidia bacterium]
MIVLLMGWVQAQPIASESFDGGAAGAPLHGFPSGDLATETWRVQNSSLTNYLVSDGAPLVYPGLASTPAYATGGGQYLYARLRLDDAWNGIFAQNGYLSPTFSIGYDGTTSKTLWLSLLARNDQTGNTGYKIGMTQGLANYAFGIAGSATGTWSLVVDGTALPSAVPVVVGEATLLVLRLDFIDDTTTTLSLYINPAGLGTAAPPTPDVSQTYNGTYGLRYLNFYSGPNPGQGSLDEIRFGATFADVTPPGSFTLDISATDGTVSRSPDQPYYAAGDTVVLTAQPALGYVFAGWSGDTASTDNPLLLVMDGSKQLTATFDPGTAPPAYIPLLYELVPDHQILLPVHLLLGDSSLFSNQLSFVITPDDTSMQPVPVYQAGDQTLIVAFNGRPAGTFTLTIDVYDGANLVATAPVDIEIASQVRPDNQGIRYAATDVAHWQPRPYKVTAISKAGYPVVLDESYIIWRLNESSGQAETDANYFFHGIMSGLLIPRFDGDYTFEVNGDAEGNHTLWLAEGLDFNVFPNESNPINPTNYTAYLNTPGTVTLEAGKPYYFEVHHRQIINDWEVELRWRTPDNTTLRRLTQADVVRYVDVVLPSAPQGLVATMGETVALLSWDLATDNDAVAGYHVFVNGARMNDTLLTQPGAYIDGLLASTAYEFAVVAVDVFGNHSFPSDLLRRSTTAPSSVLPATPADLRADVLTAFKAELSWAPVPGALGYDLWLDGVLQNAYLLSDTTYVLPDLVPETAYQVAVKALNVSLLASAVPAVLDFTTLAFDVSNPNEDRYLAQAEVRLEPLVKATGLMLNFSQQPGDALLRQDPPAFDSLMQVLQPSGFRFGAITANSISYVEATGPTAAFVTYGEYAQATLDAGGRYLALTAGPGNDEDYYNTPTTFLRLMEYLGGDASTLGGARRIAEGYQAPFIPQFDRIFIELGNEVWGGNAHDVPIGADYTNQYLPWVKQATDLIISSPYYDPEKIAVVVSARSPQFPGFQVTIFNSPILSDTFPFVLGLSGYVGGNIMDNGEDYGSLVNNRLAYHKQSYQVMSSYLSNLNQINADAERFSGRRWPLFPYESNSTQNTYHGSLGQALLIVDYLQEYVKRGGVVPALFHLQGGQWRMITQNSDGTYTRRPLFEVAALFNQTTRDGILLRSSLASVRQLRTPGGTPYNLPPVGVHAFNRGQQYAVLCFSRDYEHDFLLKLDLPDTLGTLTHGRIITLTGSNFDAEQVSVTVDSVQVSDGMLVAVPRYSLVMVVFDGPDYGLEAPLFPEPAPTVGIGRASRNTQLAVYPSPVSGHDATLVLRGYAGQTVQIRLVDALGREKLHMQTRIAHAESDLPLPVAQLPAGMYVVVVEGAAGRQSVRLLVR